MRETVSKEALASAPATNDDETSELMAQAFQHSFEKLCLSAGLRAFQDMMAQEVAALCGARHQRQDERQGRRWGTTRSRVPYHGGEVPIERPRVRTVDGGRELELPSWTAAMAEDWLGPCPPRHTRLQAGASESAPAYRVIVDARRYEDPEQYTRGNPPGPSSTRIGSGAN